MFNDDFKKGFHVSLGFYVATIVVLLFAMFAMQLLHRRQIKKAVQETMALTTGDQRRIAGNILAGNEYMVSANATEQERAAAALQVLSSEHMVSANATEQERAAAALRVLSSEHMTQKEQANAALQALTSEHFNNPYNVTYPELPMLGGADLTKTAKALRIADPRESDPISESERQYRKENELLEYLLNQ